MQLLELYFMVVVLNLTNKNMKQTNKLTTSILKNLILLICLFQFSMTSQAQWTGPTSGILSTSNQVNINTFVTAPCYGTLPTNPLFNISLTQCTLSSGNVNEDIFKANWNSVEIFKPLYLSSILNTNGDIYINRSTTVKAFEFNTSGRMKIITDGGWLATRGLFIDNPTNNFFSVTEEQVLFKNATQDLFKVDANGYLYARKAVVTLANPYPDYVFEKDYKLPTINELDVFIKKYHHLPNVPSLAEVDANNKQIDIGEMQVKLLEKVEELTLYIIAQQKQIDSMKVQLDNK